MSQNNVHQLFYTNLVHIKKFHFGELLRLGSLFSMVWTAFFLLAQRRIIPFDSSIFTVIIMPILSKNLFR